MDFLICKDESDDNDNLEESDQELVQVNGINDGHESSDMDADDWKEYYFLHYYCCKTEKEKRYLFRQLCLLFYESNVYHYTY